VVLASVNPSFFAWFHARRDILARLLKLNHERYAEEVRQGLHEKKKASKPKKTKARANAETNRSLFD